MTTSTPDATTAALRAEIRFLALLLMIFSVIKIIGCSLAYVSAILAGGGVDPHGGHTLYWMPQVFFYTVLFASSRRLRELRRGSRTAVVSLAGLSLGATLIYMILDFTIGSGSADPAMAIAIKLRLLAGGDVWDIVFPVLAILWLRAPEARALAEGE